MSKRQQFSDNLAFGIVTALGIGVLGSLSGCVGSSSVFDHVVKVFTEDSPPLTAASSRELNRFNTVYHQYARPGSDSKQLKHFEEAYRRAGTQYLRQGTEMKLNYSGNQGRPELKRAGDAG